jgi:DNA-binding transcriptional LysR family regulator
LEFMQLEMFVALVEERTVRGASTRVFRTQPAVSMAIRKLEDEVGTALFVRVEHGRALTEAGEILYRCARKLLDFRREALTAVDEVRSRSIYKR